MDERLLNRILRLIRGVALGEIFEQEELNDLTEAIEAMNNPPLKAKPLLFVGIPWAAGKSGYDDTRSALAKVIEQDYHVLVYSYPHIKECSFQVFYESDFNEVKYEELKSIVLKQSSR